MKKKDSGFWKLCGKFRITEQEKGTEPEKKTDGDMVRKKLIFKGEVQFVGFRFQSKYLADTLGLTGYVENLPNGDVRMEVQGRMETIRDMILCLHQKKPIRIDSIEEEELPLREREKGFRYMW